MFSIMLAFVALIYILMFVLISVALIHCPNLCVILCCVTVFALTAGVALFM